MEDSYRPLNILAKNNWRHLKDLVGGVQQSRFSRHADGHGFRACRWPRFSRHADGLGPQQFTIPPKTLTMGADEDTYWVVPGTPHQYGVVGDRRLAKTLGASLVGTMRRTWIRAP